mmetsp:Transcript_2766/g.10966  ORF Transcript_2766/g.10966 Transcript_2766/m.10966 type:complete len:243 (+) Transcript_2766:699-1427(+)
MEGSARMRDTKREYTISTLSTSSPTNSAYTSSAIACASSVLGAWPIAKDFTRLYSGRRLKYVVPFLPMVTSFASTPCALSSAMRSSVFLMMKLLKPPHKPRSPVQRSSSTDFTGRTAHRGTSTSSPARRVLMAKSTLTSDSEKGRALMTASCARRTFAAATSFIAEVIFFVEFTDAMRSRISFWDALWTWRVARPPATFLGATAETRVPLKADLFAPTRAGLTAAIDMVTAAIAKSGVTCRW